MKHLTLLLFWLSVLTLGAAAQAADTLLPASADVLLPPAGATDAPVGRHKTTPEPLPPPPPAIAPAPAAAPVAAAPAASAESPPLAAPGFAAGDGAISFALNPASPPIAPEPPASPPDTPALNALFAGNENSLVAKAVGAAEGTRTPTGDRNPAYWGHTDPGNGVWNLGSFSYQHAAASPEDADAKQLARLRSQADQIVQKAADKGFALSLSEKLNGIDLANQAPLAALGQQGYVDWLAVAKAEGKPEADAVLSARVRSFIDPRTQRWNAPGLGNSEERITRDQARRMAAIDRAIGANLQQIAQMPSAGGEMQLMSQQSGSAFRDMMPTASQPPDSSTNTSWSGATAEAPNTDAILNLNL